MYLDKYYPNFDIKSYLLQVVMAIVAHQGMSYLLNKFWERVSNEVVTGPPH